MKSSVCMCAMGVSLHADRKGKGFLYGNKGKKVDTEDHSPDS